MKYLYLAFVGFILIGCSSTKNPADQSTADSPSVVSGIDGVYSGGGSYDPGTTYSSDQASEGDYFDDPNYGINVIAGPSSPAKDRVIYFAFDSTNTTDSRAYNIIKAHAEYLKEHPNTKILLEGHTDSRGSRGYNIALGERRAIHILKMLDQLQVSPKQIRVISYGEERPAVQGFTEDSYKRNRRVVIQY